MMLLLEIQAESKNGGCRNQAEIELLKSNVFAQAIGRPPRV
jgi:hypothetical protein